MVSRLTAITAAVCLLAVAPSAGGQDGWVTIRSNMEGATVLVDSVTYGRLESSPVQLEAGQHHISLLPPMADSWYFTRPAAEISVTAGDTLTLALDFPYVYQVNSEPYGAEVLLVSEDGNLLLGSTPLLLRRERPIDSALLLKKEGYLAERVTPDDQLFTRIDVRLDIDGRVADAAGKPIWKTPRPSRRWISYGAAAFAVTSGVIAVHYKMKADNVYDQYELTGDPNLRPQIKRYDTYSAIALGGMQIGVGVLAIRLILR